MHTLRAAGAASILVLVSAGTAGAQGSGGLAGLLPELILREITLPAPTTPGLSHAAHFSPVQVGDTDNPAVGIVDSFNGLLTAQLASIPLGSSAGGFTYAFDPTLGTFVRASRSFGPTFAERAATIGKGRFSFGFNYQHTSYETFEGEDLRNGSIKFYLRHQECCSTGGAPVPPFFGVVQQPNGTRFDPFFEGDVIEAALSLHATTDTFAFFGNYGLTNRWDVALAVPVVRVDLEASVLATIQRLATASNALIHTFELGNAGATQRTFERSGTATGIGDIVLRTKYRFLGGAGGGLAAAADFRLPTGNEDDLLGGNGQAKLFLVASGGNDRFGHHVNVGYTISAGEASLPASLSPSLPDEFNYVGGVEFVASPRLTLLADIVGRNLRDVGRLRVETKQFEFQPPDPTQPRSFVSFEEFAPHSGSMNLVFATAGAKFNPVGDLLFSASVLLPLTDGGLKSRWTTVVGLDYAF